MQPTSETQGRAPACGNRHAWLRGIGALCLLLCLGTAAAPRREFHEHDIKAAFLFRFLQLVEWPADTFETPESPIVIGIVGKDPFGPVLDDTVRGERIDNRQIQIKRSATVQGVLPCQLLFVPNTGNGTPPLKLTASNLHGMLLVGEAPNFLNQGGMINFYMLDNQVRFEICPEAAEQAQIRIRSRLLRLARIIDCSTKRGPH